MSVQISIVPNPLGLAIDSWGLLVNHGHLNKSKAFGGVAVACAS